MNCAHIYNEACTSPTLHPLLPHRPGHTYELPGEMVSSSFYLHCLLLDCSTQHTHLSLPHNLLHDERLLAALVLRNHRMSGTGQEQWGHACHKCSMSKVAPDGTERMLMRALGK
jgi:hypothetical protein